MAKYHYGDTNEILIKFVRYIVTFEIKPRYFDKKKYLKLFEIGKTL